jgi:hypothetical protein
MDSSVSAKDNLVFACVPSHFKRSLTAFFRGHNRHVGNIEGLVLGRSKVDDRMLLVSVIGHPADTKGLSELRNVGCFSARRDILQKRIVRKSTGLERNRTVITLI